MKTDGHGLLGRAIEAGRRGGVRFGVGVNGRQPGFESVFGKYFQELGFVIKVALQPNHSTIQTKFTGGIEPEALKRFQRKNKTFPGFIWRKDKQAAFTKAAHSAANDLSRNDAVEKGPPIGN